MSLQVIAPTCDKYVKFFPGFFRQWAKYCGLTGMVVCEQTTPKVPAGWSFFRGGIHTPGKNWAGNLIQALEQVAAEVVLLVLDDYWLMADVDVRRIRVLADWMTEDRTIDKIDLTNDRLGFAHAEFNSQFVRALPMAQYLTSVQAALWSTSFLRKCISNEGWNPWQFEVQGSRLATQFNHKVLGCKVPAIHYVNMVLKGKIQAKEIARLSDEDQRSLEDCGAFDV